MRTLRQRLEYSAELLRGDGDLPPDDKDRAAIAANIEEALNARWATGRMGPVDFHPEGGRDDEMMVSIYTRQGGVVAGPVHWRMVRPAESAAGVEAVDDKPKRP